MVALEEPRGLVLWGRSHTHIHCSMRRIAAGTVQGGGSMGGGVSRPISSRELSGPMSVRELQI
ncbi:hypothetical protein EYF80_053491 [Liparis tanakae]|uniref:Uncharacterized protein n=1 Tax=Liparis tanakae TaxID=230148 RepID=A0A4Z2F7Q2_9TELE|nr:hypothetical protein EYF80_053491 [Liparis tanakae]